MKKDHFNDRFRYLKRQSGLSCDDIAFALKITRRTVQSWLSGNSQPKAGQLLELAELLGVSPNEMFYRVANANCPVTDRVMKLVGSMSDRDGETLLALIEAMAQTKPAIFGYQSQG